MIFYREHVVNGPIHPSMRSSMGSCILENTLYAWGGLGSGHSNDLWGLCLDTGIWKLIKTKNNLLPPKRTG